MIAIQRYGCLVAILACLLPAGDVRGGEAGRTEPLFRPGWGRVLAHAELVISAQAQVVRTYTGAELTLNQIVGIKDPLGYAKSFPTVSVRFDWSPYIIRNDPLTLIDRYGDGTARPVILAIRSLADHSLVPVEDPQWGLGIVFVAPAIMAATVDGVRRFLERPEPRNWEIKDIPADLWRFERTAQPLLGNATATLPPATAWARTLDRELGRRFNLWALNAIGVALERADAIGRRQIVEMLHLIAERGQQSADVRYFALSQAVNATLDHPAPPPSTALQTYQLLRTFTLPAKPLAAIYDRGDDGGPPIPLLQVEPRLQTLRMHELPKIQQIVDAHAHP